MGHRVVAALVLVVATLTAGTASTATAAVVPVSHRHRAEPPLVSRQKVLEALTCWGDPRHSSHRPVLFLHGTTSNSVSDWSWNWNRAFRQRHWAYCDVDLPDSGNADIQVAAEYVVRGIEILHRRAGGRISLVGHSQGGMIGRWALKYWPRTRAMVDDYVGLSSSNYGTADFNALCATGTCTPANWQQRQGSAFLRALDHGPDTWPGISYTEVSTREDEIVVPSTSPYLKDGHGRVTNVAVQDLCPAETIEHFGMSADNAAWLIGLDALTHPGPARLSRISTATCGHPFMPGVDVATAPQHIAAALAQTARSSATSRMVSAEPPLKPYAR